MSRRGTITISSASGSLRRLKSSLARRLARLRSTAGPSLRVAATPNREAAPVFGITNRVMKRPESRLPCSYARSKSGRWRRRSARDSLLFAVAIEAPVPASAFV